LWTQCIYEKDGIKGRRKKLYRRALLDKLLIQEDPALYYFINQGCLTVDNMDDKEEMQIVDVRQLSSVDSVFCIYVSVCDRRHDIILFFHSVAISLRISVESSACVILWPSNESLFCLFAHGGLV